MIDPNDPGTLDLIAACEEPLSGAERARRHRLKKKQEREAGQRAELDLKAPELALLAVALGEFRERWQRVPSKLQAVDALLPRLPSASVADAFPGDSAWLPDAAQQLGVWPNYVAHSVANVEQCKSHSPLMFRQTPHGQPEVDELLAVGDLVWTSYGTGPYLVKRVIRHEWRGLRQYSLVLNDADGRKGDSFINEVVAVDGRLLKMFANNQDEVFVAKRALADGYVEANELDAIRAEIQRERARAASVGQAPSFDDLAFSLLTLPDQALLTWGRRNEELVRDTPPEQVYPADPEKRNVLGKVLCDKHELNGRYQVLLEQAIELYELVDLEQHTPRMSRPADFLREYKRHSESYAGHVSAGSAKWTTERFNTFGKRPAKQSEWQVRAEKAEAELAYLRTELQQIGDAVPAATAEVERVKAQAPSDIEARLRAEIAGLQRQNALEIADRGRAFDAVAVLQERLKKAGLVSDYRKQPGE